MKVVKSKKPKDFTKTSYVRKTIGYHFRTLLPWENAFWSLGLEHKILKYCFSYQWSPNRSLTLESQVMLSPEEEIPALSAYVGMNHMLETVFPPFPLSHSLNQASGAMWSSCMFPWDIGSTYTFKLTKPRNFTLCRSFCVRLASLPSCQMADHLLCVRIYF